VKGKCSNLNLSTILPYIFILNLLPLLLLKKKSIVMSKNCKMLINFFSQLITLNFIIVHLPSLTYV